MDDATTKEVAKIKAFLGLNPEAHEFNLVYGAINKDDKEIAILTRSMLEITVEVSSRVEVPAVHVKEKRAAPGFFDMPDADKQQSRGRIQSSTKKPADAFVVVPYRDYWFYIDDRDFRSKRMFTFLMFLFTPAETGAPEKAPILTIPTG